MSKWMQLRGSFCPSTPGLSASRPRAAASHCRDDESLWKREAILPQQSRLFPALCKVQRHFSGLPVAFPPRSGSAGKPFALTCKPRWHPKRCGRLALQNTAALVRARGQWGHPPATGYSDPSSEGSLRFCTFPTYPDCDHRHRDRDLTTVVARICRGKHLFVRSASGGEDAFLFF